MRSIYRNRDLIISLIVSTSGNIRIKYLVKNCVGSIIKLDIKGAYCAIKPTFNLLLQYRYIMYHTYAYAYELY